MKRFQFRLERFLELRKWKEREWELKLARVLGQCLLLEKRIGEIREEISASRQQVFSDGVRIDMIAMSRRELYIQRLTREKERSEIELVERRRELEEVRAKYLEASKARKVLDKLRERKETEYYEHALDEEYKAIDDMNTAATTRVRW